MDTIYENEMTGARQSAEEMDEIRQRNIAYQYLCHLEEAKVWLEAVLKEELPPTTELEENLRNGVYLAKIGHILAPEIVPMSRIFDVFQHRYKSFGLHFKHTENINYWIKSLHVVKLPKTFQPETTDVYDKKNIPKVIYCIHALSTHLFRLGRAPLIQDLYGKVQFTKQDIDTVCSELKKHGITVPAFQKIGGLLAGDLDVNGAALHAAVIQINDAIDMMEVYELEKSLENPACGLKNILKTNMTDYLKTFSEAKHVKCVISQNKTLDESYEADVYDELLTQVELQGHIHNVNISIVFDSISEALKTNNISTVREIMLLYCNDMKHFNKDNINMYIDELINLNRFKVQSVDDKRHVLETVFQSGNQKLRDLKKAEDFLSKLKQVLLAGTCVELLEVLKNSYLKVRSFVREFAAPLYFEEMKLELQSTGTLELDVVMSSVQILSNIADVTAAVDTGDYEILWEALSKPGTYCQNLDPALKMKYLSTLTEMRQDKILHGSFNTLLNISDIQECIDLANSQDDQQTRTLILLEKINEAVRGSDTQLLIKSLDELSPGEVVVNDIPLCLKLLQTTLTSKQNQGEGLWLDDVVGVVQDVHKFSLEARRVCDWLLDVNTAVTNNQETTLMQALQRKQLQVPRSLLHLMKSLREVRRRKEKQSNSPWIQHKCFNERVYINLEENSYQWIKPVQAAASSYFLSTTDIEHIVKQTNCYLNKHHNEFTRHDSGNRVEYLITLLQAHARGFLVRQRIRKHHLTAIKIQSWWRCVSQRRIYLHWLEQINSSREQTDFSYYYKYIDKIIKIQAAWRGYYTRKQFSCLATQQKPSLPMLRHLAPRIKLSSQHYSTDVQIQAMKSNVVQTIKHIQELSRQLDEVDTKIGLLVQNRITLQVVMAERRKVHEASINNNCIKQKGINMLSKETKSLLDNYKRLFYILQVNPAYFSRLLIHLPSTKATDMIKSCILTLFNYGSTTRDSYLLLGLFRSAVYEEIQFKTIRPFDVDTGNSFVLKLAIAYARQCDGHNALRAILGPTVEQVLNDNNLCIDTNPVYIYTRWINQMETESGRCSELPHTVSQEQALQHPEVVNRLDHSINTLKYYVKGFLERLAVYAEQLPYVLKFIAKALRDALLQKFPDTKDKEIVKIVGHLLYYQYINSAIVAPDAFHIVNLPPDRSIKAEQRRNLASIAKMLQFAASKKGFGEEAPHLMKLNHFIIECHEEMKRFCKKLWNIEDLDEHYSMTKYSDAELIVKPRLYITLQEICECHQLLLEQRNIVAPDDRDQIHDIIDDLGSMSNVYTLLGGCTAVAGQLKCGEAEVCLELDSRYDKPAEASSSMQKLFIRTKEIITSRLEQLHGDTLAQAIRTPQHNDIAINLVRLERAGLITKHDGYHTIIQSISDDIMKQEVHRRAQHKEKQQLRATLKRLNEKKIFYEEKMSYYEEYLQTCLRNMVNVSDKKDKDKGNSYKYSGAKLREKGILVALDGVPPGQLKNVQFEITSTPFSGIFSVRGRFMGVEVEKIDVDIQELLRLQYEGKAVMDLFGRAQINVNLLLYLLNKKFYSRK